MEREIGKLTSWSWEAIGALCCFSGGIVAALVGSALTVVTWFTGGNPWVHSAGTILLVLTIPLLIFSGYCLDWMERDQNKHRREINGKQKR